MAEKIEEIQENVEEKASTGTKRVYHKWWHSMRKYSTICGTTIDTAFHASLATPDTPPSQSPTHQLSLSRSPCTDSHSSSLPLSVFSEVLPYYPIPMCGVYGLDDYQLTDLLVLLLLPPSVLYQQPSLLPQALQSIITHQTSSVVSEDALFAVIVHSIPDFSRGVDHPLKHLNILFHMLAFSGPDSVSDHVSVKVGVFGPYNVREVLLEDIPEELNGIPFNRLGVRIQYMHNSFFLSPHNCHLQCCDGVAVCSFFVMAVLPDTGRISVTYHIIPLEQSLAESVSTGVSKSGTVLELLTCLRTVIPSNGGLEDNNGSNAVLAAVEDPLHPAIVFERILQSL